MEFVNRPIVEFLRDSLSAAYKRGFIWCVSEADVEDLYSNLHKAWSSFNSITGKYFLFVVAGKENSVSDYPIYWNSRIRDSETSYFSEYNRYIEFLNQEMTFDADIIKDYFRSICTQMNKLEENQTMAINSLKEYFSIEEKDVPCLVFIRLNACNCNDILQVVPISGNNIYGYFKVLFNSMDPLLKEYIKIHEQKKN